MATRALEDTSIEDTEFITDPSEVDEYFIARSKQIDIVGTRYQLHLDRPIPALDGGFAKAYEATSLRQASEQIYALIFEPNLLIRTNIINLLKTNSFENIALPLEAEIVKISTTQEEHIVTVMQKPPSMNLVEYVALKGPCATNFIVENILVPVGKLLQRFESMNLVHGRINPENIYINQATGVITIGECISEPPYFSQKLTYTPLELADCVPIARNTNDTGVDYYALGVTCLYLYLGIDLAANISKEILMQMRFENGSYATLTKIKFEADPNSLLMTNASIPYSLRTLLKGLMGDKRNDRWKSRQLIEWYNGQKNSNINPENVEASRPISFNGKSYFNCRALAHDLQKHWELSRRFVKEDKIVKWVERGIGNVDIADKLNYLSRLSTRDNPGMQLEKDEMITKYLCALDPTGPVRFKDFSVTIEGITLMLSYGYAKSRKELLDNCYKLMYFGSWASLADLRQYDKRYVSDNSLIMTLDKCRDIITRRSYGFGLERCLYNINPRLPCLSEILKGEYISSVKELLESLDRRSKEANIAIMDRHIAAFILSKFDVDKDIRVSSLSHHPLFSERKEIIALAILSIAQRETGIKKLEGITNLSVTQLEPCILLIHNKKTQDWLRKRLLEVARTGHIAYVLGVISEAGYIKRDLEGFVMAAKRYKKLSLLKIQLQDKSRIYEIGYRYGLRLSVILSYLLCSILWILLAYDYV